MRVRNRGGRSGPHSIRPARRLRRAVLVASSLFWLSAPPASALEAAEVINITWDVLVLRPIGLAQTLFGTALFVPAFIISAGNGNADELADVLIFRPFEMTFERPLGATW